MKDCIILPQIFLNLYLIKMKLMIYSNLNLQLFWLVSLHERGGNTGNSRNGTYFKKINTQFGPIEVQVPRDYNGKFHQHTDTLENMVIKLYSKGVTPREITDLIEKMYSSHYSPSQVSNISSK